MNAFVFPGQGSQSVGMLADYADKYSVFDDYYRIASERLDFDMWELIATDASDLLNQTAYTQPAILSASCALWQLWLDEGGLRPDIMAGHSLGEYSALVAAGAMAFEDAVSLVHLRGKLMQDAVDDGIMLAIVGLDHARVADVCKAVSKQLGEYAIEPANYNAPDQVVVAGKTESLNAVKDEAMAAGAKRVIKLPVSVPSHCSLMKKASEKLADALNRVKLHNATVPVIQNSDAIAHTDAVDLARGLEQQLYKPVLWSKSVQYLLQNGVTTIYECGPGKVLQGLIKRITRDTTCFSLSNIDIFNQLYGSRGSTA